MAGLNIGDVFMRVMADMTGFEADVTKQATKAGDKAGKTLGSRMKAGMAVGLTAVGGAAGVVFGVAARGAAELTDAMANFQRETGATAEELASARKSVLALSSTSLQSFDEIARTQAALRTQMGLTQAQAEANTQAFLDYGTATGQDASEGVAAFDDILDSWGLTAEDAGDIMDKLVVSHQKYGGVIADNQKTLAALAPSMKAANFEIDDGIALLNLFGAKGIDANTASAAFAKSLTKVKSPEELKTLIDDIANTEDPFERASKAADLFGARAGAKLANALDDADLDDYKVGMDQAAGATERAADAIESTPFNQLKMALRGIAAPAIEAGQAFGPLLLALSQLGGGRLVAAASGALGALGGKLASKLFVGKATTEAISSGLAGSLEKATAETGPAGRAMSSAGGRLGKVFGLALAAGAVIFAAELADMAKPHLDKFAKEIHDFIFQGPLEDVGNALEGVGRGLNDLPWPLGPKGAPDWARIGSETKQGAETVGSAVSSTPDIISTNLKEGRGTVSAGAKTMVSGISDEVEAEGEEAGDEAGGIPTNIASGILEKQGAVGSAMAALRAQMEQERTPWQHIGDVIGALTSKELAKGLNDGRPGVRAVAEQTQKDALAELQKFVAGGSHIGKAAMSQLNAALKSKNPEIRAAARQIKSIIEGNVKPNTKPAGQAGGKGVIAGLNSQSGPVGTAAYNLGRRVATYVLKGVTFKINTDVPRGTPVKPRAGGGPVDPMIAGRMAGGGVPFAYQVNERGQELFVPQVRGRVLTAHEARTIASARAGSGSSTTNVNLQTYGLPMKAETPLEVARQVRRVNAGIVKPRQRRSWSAT